MGAGIARGGRITDEVETLVLRGDPDGLVLRALINGEVVDETTPIEHHAPVTIALLDEATQTTWGHLVVGSHILIIAPLNDSQKRQREDHLGLRANDGRPLSSLIELREQRAGVWTWELRNVAIDAVVTMRWPVVDLTDDNAGR